MAFEFAEPPGPGIVTALPPSTADTADDGVSAPSGSSLLPGPWPAGPDLGAIDYNSPEAWQVFFGDLLEILSRRANSFEGMYQRRTNAVPNLTYVCS